MKEVGDKLDYSPPGLGFGRSGAPERRDGTESYGVAYHVFTSVIRVVYAKDSLTLCVGSSSALASLS